jgi:Spy/CpxP family protein refolding chaperone
MKNLRVLFSLLIIGSFAVAGCGDNGQSPAEPLMIQNDERDRFANGILNMIESEVDLSESQKAEFKKLADELAAEMTAKHAACKAEMEKFAAAFKNSTISDADLDKIVPNFFPKERHAFMQSKLIQAHQLLTPEQRAKVADKLEARYNDMNRKHELRKNKKEMRGIAGGYMLKKLTRDLNLTDAQKANLLQIAETVQSKIGMTDEPIRHAQMQAFISEFRKDKMDEAVLNQGAAQLEAKQAEVRSAMKDAIRAVHAMLTPEQRAKASEKAIQMAEQHAKFDGNRHGRRQHWGKHRQE